MTTVIVNKIRLNLHAGILSCVVLAVWPLALNGQDISYDGKRWLEVEVSVFTNEYFASENSEQPIAENLALQYLPKLQKLLTPISSLMIDFPEPELPTAVPQTTFENAEQQIEVPRQIGPVYSPAVRDSFKVNGYARDAFIALADRLAQFNSINRNLADSSEHKILWHQVWRQPLEPRAQTPAIFVYGGEVTGNHAELEGSLRLSDIGGRAMLDINLWLNRFGNSAAGAESAVTAESEWKAPDLPLPLEETEDAVFDSANPRTITEIWQMQQTRELGANQLYYLDHPAFGVIIQVRPYMLPEQAVATDEEDF